MAPTLWFIDLILVTCHIQYTFLGLCQFFSWENGQNTKICAQSINTERASLKPLWFGSILEWAQAIVILGLLTFQVDWNTFSVTTVSRYIYKQSSPSPPEKKTRSNSTFSPSPFSLPSVWLLQFILFQKKNWSVRVMWNCWETEKTCSWNTLMAMQDENCRHFMRFKRFLFC